LHIDDRTATFTPGIQGTGSLAVKFGTCNGAFNNGAELWVDWADVGSWTKGVNSVGTWQGTSSGNGDPPGVDYAFTITVPPGTVNGPHRARLMMEEGVPPPLDPCSSFSYGSCIDFTLDVGGAILAPSGGGGGISGGSVLLILFFVGVPVYIAGGCIYKRKKLGTTGMKESCPQNEFWFDMFPALVKEGFHFVLVKLKIKKEATGDYDSL
jgi:hypothetical protein